MLTEKQETEVFAIEQEVRDLFDDVKDGKMQRRALIADRLDDIADKLNFWQNDGDLNRKELLTEQQDMELFNITQDVRDLQDNVRYCSWEKKFIMGDLLKIANKLKKF